MPLSRAPKKAPKKSAVKKSAAKTSKKVGKKDKKSAGPRLFPTKAELEALKLAREADSAKKDKKSAGPRLFPTKAELEAMKAASSGQKPSALVAAQNALKAAGKKTVKIDGEEVEIEEVELEDLEKLVSETTEENKEGDSDVRVVNLSEEAKQEEGEFTLKDSEEDDAPPQTVLTAGATQIRLKII